MMVLQYFQRFITIRVGMLILMALKLIILELIMFSSSKTQLTLFRSMSETDNDYDGYDIYTREETLYLTKQ